MTDFDKDQILACIDRLENLKKEHQNSIRKLIECKQNFEDDYYNMKKIKIIERSLETVHQAILDAKSILSFYSCLENYELEQNKTELELRVLKSENTWQKNEIKNLIMLVQEKDRSILELESKLENFSFNEKLNSLNISNYSKNTCFSQSYIKVSEINEIVDKKEEIDKNFNNFNFDQEVSSKMKSLHPLIIQYVKQGKYEIAIPLCKQVVEDIIKNKGRDDPDVAIMLYIMALVYRDTKNYKESIRCMNESLVIREKIYGHDDLSVASTLNNLSVLYGKIKQFDNAECACLQALKIREIALGSTHADVAKQLINLGIIYQNNKKFDDAEDCFIRAKTIFELELGNNDPYFIKTLNNLGILYSKQEKFIDAKNIFENIILELYDSDYQKHRAKNGNCIKLETQENDGYNLPYSQIGEWHKSSRVDTPTMNSIFKYLNTAYVQLNETEKVALLNSIKQVDQPNEKIIFIKKLISYIKADMTNLD